MAITPLMIELNEQHVIIVGGGRVAERRVHSLLNSGAAITVISPTIKEGIESEWKKGRLHWKQKYVEAKDLADAFLVIVATDDQMVNQEVIHASPRNSLINAAADADKGNVEFPSFFRRGKLLISISTSGASPQLSAAIKNELQTVYDGNYESYIDFLYESRKLIKHSSLDKAHQKLLLKELLSETFLEKDKQNEAIEWFRNLAERGEAI
ncbi:NAD(P)-binding protein [Virgibacillus ainsalahensis]